MAKLVNHLYTVLGKFRDKRESRPSSSRLSCSLWEHFRVFVLGFRYFPRHLIKLGRQPDNFARRICSVYGETRSHGLSVERHDDVLHDSLVPCVFFSYVNTVGEDARHANQNRGDGKHRFVRYYEWSIRVHAVYTELYCCTHKSSVLYAYLLLECNTFRIEWTERLFVACTNTACYQNVFYT